MRWAQACCVVAVALALHALSDRLLSSATSSCGLPLDGLLRDGSLALLYSERVVTPLGVQAAVIAVAGGRIVSVTPSAQPPKHAKDFGRLVLSPGLVDVHVHINEPGRTSWEGFESGTRAAAAGGVTTVVVQPLNSEPATTSLAALQLKLKAAKGKLFVDAAFWGGLVPQNAINETSLVELLAGGVVGLKAFMSPSGIDDFGSSSPAQLAVAMRHLGRRPLMVHAELPHTVQTVPGADPFEYSTYLATRPRTFEADAIRELVALANRETPIHIAHLADAGSLPLIREAKRLGKALTVETCPHYLSYADVDVAMGDTRFKCAPPLRDAANRDALLRALVAGELDMVSSDHSPSPPALKENLDFLQSWGGISSLQFSLPATWQAARAAGATLEQMASWWSEQPAALVGLAQKGSLEPGKDADIVVWDPDQPADMTPVFHQNKAHPYDRPLHGRVMATFLSGQVVFDNGVHSPSPCGRVLLH